MGFSTFFVLLGFQPMLEATHNTGLLALVLGLLIGKVKVSFTKWVVF